MGYQVGASCYGDEAGATQAIAAAQTGAVVQSGSVVYVVDAVPSAPGSITYTLNPLGGGSAVVSVVPVHLQPCGLLEWGDGLTLAWGVAAAWIATAAVMHLRQAVHS